MDSIIKFRGQSWKLSITRNMSFFHACLAVRGYRSSFAKFGVARKNELYITLNGMHSEAFFCESDMSKHLESIYNISIDPKKLKKLEIVYKITGRKLLEASKKLEKNPNVLNYNNFIKAYSDLCPGLSLTSVFGRYTNEILKTELAKIFPEKNSVQIDSFIAAITYPAGHTPLFNSQVYLLEFAVELQRKKISYSDFARHIFIDKFIQKYLKEFGAIPVNFNGERWTYQQIAEQLKELLKSDCKKELIRIKNNHENKILEKRNSWRLIKDKKLKNIATSTGVATLLNEYRKFIFCKASLAYRPMFKQAAHKYGIKDWKIFWSLTPDEFKNLYFNNDEKILNILPQRKIAGVIMDPKKGYHVFDKSELSGVMKQIKKFAKQNTKVFLTNELKGTVANLGYAKGRVKVIFDKKDFSKFKIGDVLVAPMTSVDYVPLMQMASAFITNEGGLTSHAAIVSREMNKPCIIGTKVATQVFKDGDMVEVDANKGIVKILKKK